MEVEQEQEWLAAQNIVISEDLVTVAKQQLQFLAAVDRNRCLYEGPVLQRAIYRYNACWLPMLAKHSECKISEGPIVVPLDCEWIWHCHRLNPVRYKSDCQEFYGRILDNCHILSSVQATSKEETEEIWNGLYPEEPYEFDFSSAFDVSAKFSAAKIFTKYDLVAAVQRQIPFTYQVSRPHMSDNLFLEEAVARYKGFLHLIKRNWENSLKCFCVPTYDIDLIWHSHQLHPVSYCKDLTKALGKVLEHDDTDSDRAKGKKLDVGFSVTTRQWEGKFGLRYWRAGAMYRGSAPSPLTIDPCLSDNLKSKAAPANGWGKRFQLAQNKFVEVFLEIVGVRNLPEGHKGSLFVSFTKRQPDIFFNAKRRLTILSESGDKQVASFQCEPTGELLFELISHSPSNLRILRPSKSMGFTTVSLQDFLASSSKLSAEKWLELMPSSGNVSSNQICLRVSVSVTVPSIAPYELHMVHQRPFSMSSCFPLPGRVTHSKNWTCVVDEAGTEVISIQMRDLRKEQERGRNESLPSKEVIGITTSGETCSLAELVGNGWSLMDSQWSLQPQPKSTDGHIFGLQGSRTVKLFPGRKLEYEHKYCEKRRNEHEFITAVEISPEDPYGKAVALIDLKFGILRANEEWFVLPGIAVAFILSDVAKKEGYNGVSIGEEYLKETEKLAGETANADLEMELKSKCENAVKSGGCGSGRCGSKCGEFGNSAKSASGCGGCGSGCGGGYGGGCKTDVKDGGSCGGCGGGCGGGCKTEVKDGSGCGGGCGGGCKTEVKDGGSCGSGCSGSCSDGTVKDGGGCGGGCNGGCGGYSNGAEHEADASNCCSAECNKVAPLPVNEALVA